VHVVVAGAHGLIGSALVARLTAGGHRVRRLVRGPAASSREVSWNPYEDVLDPASLHGVDAVVNLGGAGIGDHLWTPAYRRTILRSRTVPTGLLSRTIAEMDERPSVLLQASAVGFYGDRGTETLTEASAPGEGFLADVVRAWEAATAPSDGAGVRTVHLRTGMLLAPEGGALGRLLPILRLGLGGPLGDGANIWSWITLHDHVRAIEHLLTTPVVGPVNLTGPAPASQRQVVSTIAEEINRPARLAVPAPLLRLVLRDMADELLLSSQRALPTVLADSGFTWDHPSLDEAAVWLTRRR
jgi:uncharacterized protein (TIGR01777 family)